MIAAWSILVHSTFSSKIKLKCDFSIKFYDWLNCIDWMSEWEWMSACLNMTWRNKAKKKICFRLFAHCFGPLCKQKKQKKISKLISKQLELYIRISFCRNRLLGIALSISRFSFEFSFVWGGGDYDSMQGNKLGPKQTPRLINVGQYTRGMAFTVHSDVQTDHWFLGIYT